ncbi:MAG: branched-chain amino acid ABC transporter permease [Solirubrobacterales bacterium]|nr:branched-chain amino acid ABC transporter permease [Solirubrobacterales bacterium]
MSTAARPAARLSGPQALGPRAIGWAALAALAIVLLLAPEIFSAFWLSQILTRALWLGIAALSLIFLSSYGGMLSLAQVGLYGVAGFAMANLGQGVGGEALGWSPWLAVLGGLVAGTLVGLMFGAIASRSYGIYFLMITLALTLIVYYFFGQVTQLAGYGGVRNVATPGLIGDPVTHPDGLYYVSLGVSVVCLFGAKYLARTPFGLTFQGTRDEPDRMRALGYNVALHRTLAFGVGAFIASIAGILSVWWSTQISPGDVGINQAIIVLIIAVIGGLYRLEGAFVGAIVYSILDNYSRSWTPTVGTTLGPGRFSTVLGVIFLIIVLASPGGIIGLWELGRNRLRRAAGWQSPSEAQASQQAVAADGAAAPASETVSSASDGASTIERRGGVA